MPKAAAEVSEYERKRQETIAKNQALLRDLALEAASTGLAPSKGRQARNSNGSSSTKRKPAARKAKVEVQPMRKSSRLLGIVADSEVAKRKAEEEHEALRQAEQAKRQRVSGDLQLADIVTGGHWNKSGNFLTVAPANPYERTFKLEDVEETSDKEIQALRKRLGDLELWEGATPNRIKITPERIYSLGFHPSRDKPLVFAGDKLGSLGLFDASQTAPQSNEVKREVEDDDDEEDELFEPAITTFKLHTRTISSFQFAPNDTNALYSASYDSSIRKLDLAKGLAVEIYAPTDTSIDAPISGVQVAEADPNVLYFATLDGMFGMHDMRADSKAQVTQTFQLSEKKIGGFGLHPTAPHLLATASLDRTIKLWDLRKVSGKGTNKLPALVGEHESRLSVSAASWNERGQVATSSYDDTVKIYDFSDCAGSSWTPGGKLDDEQMKPTTIVPHNNQTGRWVTILRPQWQAQPSDGIQRFVIGNMNRFVDIYAHTGDQVAQLGGMDITAVPAVAQFHPSMDWVAAGTASGKLCLWM